MPKSLARRASKTTFIVGNSIVALCLIIGCYGNYINTRFFWLTGLFTLASFYFLIILIGFLFFWLFVRPGLTLISIITIFFCWGPLQQIVQIRFSEKFIFKKDSAAIRVMSWNVEHFDILEHKKHPEKKQEMIALVNEILPDVACFQEMVASDSAPNAINYLPDFVNKLDMHEYYYTYNPKLDFDSKHRFGIIIFSKLPMVKKETVSLNFKNYNAIFQYVDVVKNNDTIRVFNIHLQSLKFSADNRHYIDDPSMKDEADIERSKNVLSKFKIGFVKRKEQSDFIKNIINQSPYPVIVCGDFNDVPNSYSYNTIGKGLVNTFVKKGSGIGKTFDGISPTLRIDNIFTDKRFEVKQYTCIHKKLSDHFPVITDLGFSEN
jgi:hypothetical protein